MFDPKTYSRIAEKLAELKACASLSAQGKEIESEEEVSVESDKPGELDFEPPREPIKPTEPPADSADAVAAQVVRLPDSQIQTIGRAVGDAVNGPPTMSGLTFWQVTPLAQTVIGWKVLCPPNPRRRLLHVMTLAGGFVYVSPTPLSSLGAGIVFRSDLGHLVIEDKIWGRLPGLQWWVEDQGSAVYWLLEEIYL